MIEVTGYELRGAIKVRTLKLEALNSLFDEQSQYFPSDGKPDLVKLGSEIATLEYEIAMLQTERATYNHLIPAFVAEGKDVNLTMAIKTVGGLARLAKKWRELAGAGKKERWGGRTSTRTQGDEYELPSVEPMKCLEYATEYEKKLSVLRSAISTANAERLSIEALPDDFVL